MKRIISKWFGGFSSFCLLAAALSLHADELSLIPQPQKIQPLDGVFKLTADTPIYTDPQSLSTGEFLGKRLRQSTGYGFKVNGITSTAAESALTGGVLLTTSNADVTLGNEGYELAVTTNHVIIRAPTQTGLFYGVQTLLQLLPPEIFSSNLINGLNWQVPAIEITDWPRFKWRGYMLDVSRHFYTKSEVEQMLDAIALYKINTFHWHLVDDQGWRIEIKKYPRLTSVGAWRDGVGFDLPTNSTTAYGPDGRYGGYYTQDDIREVVAYAAALHITIVPEIEMPGHSLAALTAYPQFGTGDGLFTIPTRGGVNPGIYSPAKDGTFAFLDNVLSEVFQLFPGNYVHIGGDEVPGEPWQNDPACQSLMKREGLKSSDELESWFIRHIEKFVNANGKTLIGWSEITRGGLAQSAVVMDWIGGGREAAGMGHDVVMSPTRNCYFDYYQSRDQADEPRAIGGFLPLQKVYAFEPVPADLAPEFISHVLGAQGNLWTEYVPNLRHVEYMTFPRLTALAEVTWSAREARNYDDFLRRLKIDQRRLDQLGVNYRNSALGDGDAARGTEIGGWKPEQIRAEPAPIEWDVTSRVTASGDARLYFDYTDGACGIDIKSATLFEDGVPISQDVHDGFAGAESRQPSYKLVIPAPKPGSRYTVVAQVSGSGGTDSTGNLLWNFKPTTH
jgi:hexosaminidase